MAHASLPRYGGYEVAARGDRRADGAGVAARVAVGEAVETLGALEDAQRLQAVLPPASLDGAIASALWA